MECVEDEMSHQPSKTSNKSARREMRRRVGLLWRRKQGHNMEVDAGSRSHQRHELEPAP